MTTGEVVDIASRAIWIIIECATPLLLVSLIVGLVISIFQTVTSIQEQTLTFVPKILVMFLMIILTGDWILSNILAFIQELWSKFGDYVR
ncbi:MAG: flagellar biosynthesis protein FliQ [Lachnospiraceae bacterium]|nr:flagellar biosynthesis protein FliQ [Lachnospiraceae bacterium]